MSLDPGGLRFTPPQTSLRESFRLILKEEFRGVLGSESDPGRDHREKAFAGLMDSASKELNLEALPEKTQRDLRGLAESAEGFETIFVKGLLSQMRKSSFAEKPGPYGEMANDFMDQAVAEQTAASRGGMGLAASVFRSISPRVLREAPGLAMTEAQKPVTASAQNDLTNDRSLEGTETSKGTAKA